MRNSAKDKKDSSPTVAFTSLGCFKNLVDTEVLGGLLIRRGWRPVSAYEQADWLVINTCGFLRAAKDEAIDEVLKALERKERGEINKIAVFGCLVQRYGQELNQLFTGVDLTWGVKDFELLAAVLAGEKQSSYPDRELFLNDHNHQRIIATTPNTTFLKISEGCNLHCSFCTIPAIRGPYRSRSVDSLLQEAAKYRDLGFHELNLVSQNSTSFGRERSGCSELPQLLAALSGLGFSWIRVLYLMAEEIDDRILEAFDHPGILPYFDIPLQHVAPPVLQAMNRGGNPESSHRLLERIRAMFPAAVLRSTFIVGHPGEGEAEFQELLDFTATSAIERIGVFTFSAEEGTPAFDLAGAAAPELAEARRELLLDQSDQNLDNFNKKLHGSRQLFLPLGPWDSRHTVGRIACQAPEVDGLTVIRGAFRDSFQPLEISISGHQHEILRGVKT